MLTVAISIQPARITTQKVCFLFVNVSKTRDIATAGRVLTIRGPFGITFNLRADMGRIVVECHILTQHSAIITQSIGETARFGIEQHQVGVEAGSIYKDDLSV